jgi:hypothetical protein
MNPRMKLIVVVRNPITRAISGLFLMNKEVEEDV